MKNHEENVERRLYFVKRFWLTNSRFCLESIIGVKKKEH